MWANFNLGAAINRTEQFTIKRNKKQVARYVWLQFGMTNENTFQNLVLVFKFKHKGIVFFSISNYRKLCIQIEDKSHRLSL